MSITVLVNLAPFSIKNFGGNIMSNVLDLLLSVEPDKVIKPSKKVELKRLSELTGEAVIFTCEALTAGEFDEIQERATSVDKRGNLKNFDVNEIQLMTVLKGVKNPDLKSKDLREKFGVPTPNEVVSKLLLPGEITKLYNIISDLSGFGDAAIEEVKNA